MKTILLVEDDQNLADLVEHALREKGFEVLTARDGKTGLSLVADADLLLLNLKLPLLSGEELLGKLREDGNYVPAIVVTGTDDSEERVKRHGIVDFVSKPFSMPDLLSKVEKAVGVAENIECIGKATGRLRGFIERQSQQP